MPGFTLTTHAAAPVEEVWKLLHDPARMAAMGKAGRKRAEESFDLKRFIDQTTVIYEEALQEARKN